MTRRDGRLAGRRAGQPRPGVRRAPAQRRLPRRRRAGRADGLAVPRPQVRPRRRRRGPARRARRRGAAGRAGPAALLHERDAAGRSRRWRSSTRCRPSASSPSTTSSTSPFGTLRVKLGGGDNGHNGLRSMRSSLGTGDFYRVRVGIGRPPGRQDAGRLRALRLLRRRAQGAAVPGRPTPRTPSSRLVADGLEKTQQRFNR